MKTLMPLNLIMLAAMTAMILAACGMNKASDEVTPGKSELQLEGALGKLMVAGSGLVTENDKKQVTPKSENLNKLLLIDIATSKIEAETNTETKGKLRIESYKGALQALNNEQLAAKYKEFEISQDPDTAGKVLFYGCTADAKAIYAEKLKSSALKMDLLADETKVENLAPMTIEEREPTADAKAQQKDSEKDKNEKSEDNKDTKKEEDTEKDGASAAESLVLSGKTVLICDLSNKEISGLKVYANNVILADGLDVRIVGNRRSIVSIIATEKLVVAGSVKISLMGKHGNRFSKTSPSVLLFANEVIQAKLSGLESGDTKITLILKTARKDKEENSEAAVSEKNVKMARLKLPKTPATEEAQSAEDSDKTEGTESTTGSGTGTQSTGKGTPVDPNSNPIAAGTGGSGSDAGNTGSTDQDDDSQTTENPINPVGGSPATSSGSTPPAATGATGGTQTGGTQAGTQAGQESGTQAGTQVGQGTVAQTGAQAGQGSESQETPISFTSGGLLEPENNTPPIPESLLNFPLVNPIGSI